MKKIIFFLIVSANLILHYGLAQGNLYHYRDKLAPYDSILKQQPENRINNKGNRIGLWDFSVKQNVLHGNYYGLDTTWGRHKIDTGTIRCRGFYNRKGVPTGVWIKYMRGYEDYVREYFFYEKGVCVRHAYYDMHNGRWMYDSLNKTHDTLITPFIHGNGHYDIYYNYYGKKSSFVMGDKWLLPKDSCFTLRKVSGESYGNPYTQTYIYDTAGTIVYFQSRIKKGDTTKIVTDLTEDTYKIEKYLNWPENKKPFSVKTYRQTPNGDIEIKE